MRLSRVVVRFIAAAVVLAISVVATAQSPPGFPKNVSVPGLVMTGLGAPETTSTPPPFQPKQVKVPELQMTGAPVKPDSAPQPFKPKTIPVPTLTMTGVS